MCLFLWPFQFKYVKLMVLGERSRYLYMYIRSGRQRNDWSFLGGLGLTILFSECVWIGIADNEWFIILGGLRWTNHFSGVSEWQTTIPLGILEVWDGQLLFRRERMADNEWSIILVGLRWTITFQVWANGRQRIIYDSWSFEMDKSFLVCVSRGACPVSRNPWYCQLRGHLE